MAKKKSAPSTDRAPEQFENDPPPPYSPPESNGPPVNNDSAGTAPSAPTAADVVWYTPESQLLNQSRQSELIEASALQHRYNYGSLNTAAATAGDVHQEHVEQNAFNSLGNQTRAQTNQFQAEGNSFRALENQLQESRSKMRSHITSLREQIQYYFNVTKNRYNQIDQSISQDPNDPVIERPTRRRSRCKPFLRKIFFIAIALILVSLVIGLPIFGDKSQRMPNDPHVPKPPLSERPPSPSKSSSKPLPLPVPPLESSTKTPTLPTKLPDIPGSPDDPDNFPPDGSTCGSGCVISVYQWPLDISIRSFRLLTEGALTSGNLIVKRSKNPSKGSLSLFFQLTNLEKKDVIILFSPFDDSGGASIIISTPQEISIWSSLKARIIVELPAINENDFVDFTSITKNTKVTIGDVGASGSFHIPKLDVVTSNADIAVYPLFVTSASQQLKTSNGHITGKIRSTAGKMQLTSTNGDIRLDASGDSITIDTSNGGVSGEYSCLTKCNFKTSSGKMLIQRMQAETLLLDNRNGAIDVQSISGVKNVVATTRNAHMILQVYNTTSAPLILLSNSNSRIECTMPMEFQGGFHLATSSGNQAKVQLIDPPQPGHSLSFKYASANYVSGTKLSPDNPPSGGIRADTKNGDVSLQFVSQ